ncbi:zonular occludens toxin domain-containing protein [Rheinheimera sp.]|uniref:zonular occludens toxin domain-containing protein n=1 Tax=Rheinheimera sp. TaxID=1869214 RepID=UPI00307F740B
MLYLVTGLPGASKSLNTLKMIIEESDFSGREKYYNNVKLLMLDIEVCNSFAGWFYGVYLDSLGKKPREKVNKILFRIHKEGESASADSFPHLVHLYDAWVSGTGPLDLFVKWCRKLYKPARLTALNEYLAAAEQPHIDHIKRFNLHFTRFEHAAAWYELPRGSVIFIDECQQTFPPRPVGAKVPQHCSEFETHRHKGYDVFLVTQDAKLLDNHVRRLTGRHIHFFRPFGGTVVTRLWADKVFDPEDYFQRKQAQQKPAPRDKKYYGLYWSADLHTHKFKLPTKLLLLPLVVILLAYLIYQITQIGKTDQPEPTVSEQSTSPASQPVQQTVQAETTRQLLPFVNLLQANTPISGMCQELTYGGYEVVKKEIKGKRYTEVRHLFNCVVGSVEVQVQPLESQPEGDPATPQTRTELNIVTLDSQFFELMGFKFLYYGYTPILTYENLAFIFPKFQ